MLTQNEAERMKRDMGNVNDEIVEKYTEKPALIRDWKRDIEAGDRVGTVADPTAYAFRVLTVDGPYVVPVQYVYCDGPPIMHRVSLFLVQKREDQPGDGFERIGYEGDGTYIILPRERGDRRFACENIGTDILDSRNNFRRVYAVREKP